MRSFRWRRVAVAKLCCPGWPVHKVELALSRYAVDMPTQHTWHTRGLFMCACVGVGNADFARRTLAAARTWFAKCGK